MSDKSTKSKKQTEDNKVEDQKKEAGNAATTLAGLKFDVNLIRRFMKDHFKQNCKQTEAKKDGKTITIILAPKISNAHIAIAAALQELYIILIQNTLNNTLKDKSGLHNIVKLTLVNAMYKEAPLRKYYTTIAETFSDQLDYSKNLPIAEKIMDSLGDEKFKATSNFKLTGPARNMLCFILFSAYSEIVSTAHQFTEFARKNVIKVPAIIYSVKNIFPKELAAPLIQAILKACELSGIVVNLNNDKDDDKDDEKNDDEKDDEKDAEPEEQKKDIKKGKKKEEETKEIKDTKDTKDTKSKKVAEKKKAVTTDKKKSKREEDSDDENQASE